MDTLSLDFLTYLVLTVFIVNWVLLPILFVSLLWWLVRSIDAVVLCPCSGTTLGKLGAGIGDNLITRSAIVALKERRKLIIVPREAPYATVHLENMHKLSQWGAIVIPASPGFYNHPKTIGDMVDFVVARILDHIGLDHIVGTRWTGEEIP